MEIVFTERNAKRVKDALEGLLSYKKLIAEEWHQFVQHYNYDDGYEPFWWLIKQKICDKGTALCLYWHLSPNSGGEIYNEDESKMWSEEEKRLIKEYDEFLRNSEIGDDRKDILSELEKRYLSGFYENERFSFDPQSSDFFDDKPDNSSISKEMSQKTNGTPFERAVIEFAFLRYPNKEEKQTIEKNIKEAISILKQANPNFTFNNPDIALREIAKSLDYWKNQNPNEKEIKKLTLLSYLWLECLRLGYAWEWTIWQSESALFAVSNKTKSLTCPADTIIRNILESEQIQSRLILDTYHICGEMENADDYYDNLKDDSYFDDLLNDTVFLAFLGKRKTRHGALQLLNSYTFGSGVIFATEDMPFKEGE